MENEKEVRWSNLPISVYLALGFAGLLLFFFVIGESQSTVIQNISIASAAVIVVYFLWLRMRKLPDVWKIQSELKRHLATRRRPSLFVESGSIQVAQKGAQFFVCFVKEAGGCFFWVDGAFTGFVPGTLHEVETRLQNSEIDRAYAHSHQKKPVDVVDADFFEEEQV